MTRRRLWLGAAFCFVAGDAMAMQARGALLSSFEATFGVSESLLGLVAPAGTVGFVAAILIVGLVAGRLDARHVLVVGAAAMVASLFLIAVAPVYSLFLLALLAQGAAAGVFRAMDRPLLSHLYPERLGRIFVLYALAWAVGAVTAPALASGVLLVADWRLTYVLIGLLLVPVVVAVWTLESPTEWDERRLERESLTRLLSNPLMGGTLLGMALVGGIEGTIFTWLPYYAGTFFDRTTANLALSVYLLAYVPGRYAYAKLIESTSYLRLSALTTALAIPSIVLAVGWTGVGMLVAVFCLGLLLSSLFPLLSAYGVELAPEYSGPVSALATAATYAGMATVPAVVGVVAELTDIGTAMWIPAALTVVLFAVVLTMWRRDGPVERAHV
ncbi:MFS transporter [Natrarchaeobius chitinivorans]|uniref:MFS transporter n=1 Tax=Natrarchaeobius chitinivorans TaxID=1679083 RepID=A0A3N6MJR7_NATCH|nr:MFS transporter [Natrarchaeobius chitinivorans]RQG94466.1 MFS transporter [Natrarchaeobius chitinivorans]